MVRNLFRPLTAGLLALSICGASGTASAQGRRDFANDGPRALASDCAPTQRSDRLQSSRRAARQSDVYYEDGRYERERTKTKTALMIGGAAATGAGVGGALGGGKGALIGAAVGGGAASIYEASKRR